MSTVPIPSQLPQDLKENSGRFDEVMTSDAHYYTDRFGVRRFTIAGFEYTAKQVIAAYGYITLKSFQLGAPLPNNELTLPNQVLQDETDGEYYRWDGDFPKTVPPGSTPATAGGVGLGAWVSVGDASLRSDITKNDGLKLIGKCSSMADLRTVNSDMDGQLIILNSYRINSGKGGGVFQWNASSVVVDDGGAVIAVTGVTTGRWIRQVNGRYTPEMYGADGTKANDPAAITALIQHQKYIGLKGPYFYNREFVTNGHNVEGESCGETFGVANPNIIFFGGFSASQATRNEITKSSWRNVTFQPESWDETTGYVGAGLRLHRTLDAENCNWLKFKQFGMDLWEDVDNAYIPYYSQFRNCQWNFCGYNGVRLAQGANAMQIIGGSCNFNGSPAYGVAPTDSSTGWDGLWITHITGEGVPPPNNEMTTQGLIIDGIDCSYNSRFGANLGYCNQSRIHIGYAEANFGSADINMEDIVACDVNILITQKGAVVNVPDKGFGVTRSCANYPNHIVVNGQPYGSGPKDSFNRYINYQMGKNALTVLSVGTVGNSGLRSWEGGDGSLETYNSAGTFTFFRANAGPLPTAEAKFEGTLWRDTSIGPNGVYMCVTNGPGVYIWSKLN